MKKVEATISITAHQPVMLRGRLVNFVKREGGLLIVSRKQSTGYVDNYYPLSSVIAYREGEGDAEDAPFALVVDEVRFYTASGLVSSSDESGVTYTVDGATVFAERANVRIAVERSAVRKGMEVVPETLLPESAPRKPRAEAPARTETPAHREIVNKPKAQRATPAVKAEPVGRASAKGTKSDWSGAKSGAITEIRKSGSPFTTRKSGEF